MTEFMYIIHIVVSTMNLISIGRTGNEMTEKELRMYKEFVKCYDFEKRADELNTSRDVYYYDSRNCRTFEIEDCLDLIKYDNNGVGHIDGCILIELHHIYGYVDSLEIPVSFDLEDWNEEEQLFTEESYTIKPYCKW